MRIDFENSAPLELDESSEIEFVKQNLIFAFDDIETERTAEINIPATPHNNALLGLAGDAHRHGDMMRRRFAVQLQASGVTKDGYLYITAYENKQYKGVFVCGDLLGLKAIKEAGIFEEWYETDEKTTYPATGYISASAHNQPLFDTIGYNRYKSPLMPSINLNKLIETGAEQLGCIVDLPDNGNVYRIIPDALNGTELGGYSITRTWLQDFAEVVRFADAELCATIQAEGIENIFDIVEEDCNYNVVNFLFRKGKVQHLQCRFDVTLHFAESVSSNIMLIHLPNAIEGRKVEYFGGYSITIADGAWTTEGEALTNRDVTLQAGDTFIIVDILRDFAGDNDEVEYPPIFPRQASSIVPRPELLAVGCGITTASPATDEEPADLIPEQPVGLRDNLPDLTLIDACKAIAAMSGKMLNYDAANNRIYFDDVNINAWPVINITNNILEVGAITRTFADYAQHNTIQFEADNLDEEQRVTAEYIIDNENIEDDNELATIPFCEGSDLNGEYYNNDRWQDAGAWGVAIAGANVHGRRMRRINTIPLNKALVDMCDISTSLRIVFRCPLLMYEAINSNTLLYVDAAYYAWQELTWSADRAEALLMQVGRDDKVKSRTINVYDVYVDITGTEDRVLRGNYPFEVGDNWSFDALTEYNGYSVDVSRQTGTISEDTPPMQVVTFTYTIKDYIVTDYADMPTTLDLGEIPTYLEQKQVSWLPQCVVIDNNIYRYTDQTMTDYKCICGVRWASPADDTEERSEFIYRIRNATAVGRYAPELHFRTGAVFRVVIRTFGQPLPARQYRFVFTAFSKGGFPTYQ